MKLPTISLAAHSSSNRRLDTAINSHCAATPAPTSMPSKLASLASLARGSTAHTQDRGSVDGSRSFPAPRAIQTANALLRPSNAGDGDEFDEVVTAVYIRHGRIWDAEQKKGKSREEALEHANRAIGQRGDTGTDATQSDNPQNFSALPTALRHTVTAVAGAVNQFRATGSRSFPAPRAPYEANVRKPVIPPTELGDGTEFGEALQKAKLTSVEQVLKALKDGFSPKDALQKGLDAVGQRDVGQNFSLPPVASNIATAARSLLAPRTPWLANAKKPEIPPVTIRDKNIFGGVLRKAYEQGGDEYMKARDTGASPDEAAGARDGAMGKTDPESNFSGLRLRSVLSRPAVEHALSSFRNAPLRLNPA